MRGLGNEWRVVRRHPLVWLVFAGVAAFSVLAARGSPSDAGSTANEALLRLNLFIPAFMLPFVAGALAPIAYLRETEWGLADIVGSYPQTVRRWLAVRLGNLMVLLVMACGVAQLAFLVVMGTEYPGSWATMAAQSLLWMAIIHGPACLLWAGVLAWLASRRAHAGLLYFAAGIGWLGYLGLATLTGTPLIAGSITVSEPLRQAMLVLDPYAATAMVNPMPEAGPLQGRWINIGLGRLVWIGGTVLLIGRIASVPAHSGRQAGKGPAVPATRSESRRAGRRPGHVGLHLRYVIRDRVFPLVVLGWIALFLPEALGGMDYAEPLARIDPDSRDALNRVVWDVLPLAGALLLLYTADRVCRLYPATRMLELYAATPHRPLALLGVQFASLGSVALGSVMLSGLAVAAAQVFAGSPLQPLEYLGQLGLTLPRLLLFAAAFVALHGLIRSRLLANLAGFFIVALGLSSLAPALGLHHPLWRPLATPLAPPDHVWGYANGIEGHGAFLAFWALLCLAALLLAAALGHRTLPTPQVSALRVVRHPASLAAAALLGGAAWPGTAIDGALRAEAALTPPAAKVRLRADYERGYAAWGQRAQPEVEAVRARVDFYPEDRRVAFKASLQLINRSDQPIVEVLVGAMPGGGSGAVALDGASVLRRDVRLGQTVFRLGRPMAPGEQRTLGFRRDIGRSGLDPAQFPLALNDRFSSLPAFAVLPTVGFRRDWTLRDPKTRKEQGLAALALTAPSRLEPPAAGSLSRDRARIEAVVSTSTGHHAIGQGLLLRRWQARGRSYFHYRTDGPIRNLAAFLSVAGEPQVWPAGATTIMTHTPQRLGDDDPSVLGLRDTLAWLSRDVAPYPGNSLHLVAIPEIGPSGYALPQIIQVSHRLAFRARPKPGAGFSQAYRRAAHEAAHQWFGHLLGHGLAEERAFQIESLAKYAELVMIERRYGVPAMKALVTFERDRYRHARLDPAAPVAPLIDAEESEDMYSRATLAFACLRARVGDAPITAALKDLAHDARTNDRPATSLGFVRALKAKSPAQQAAAIDDLLLGTRPIQAVERDLRCARAD